MNLHQPELLLSTATAGTRDAYLFGYTGDRQTGPSSPGAVRGRRARRPSPLTNASVQEVQDKLLATGIAGATLGVTHLIPDPARPAVSCPSCWASSTSRTLTVAPTGSAAQPGARARGAPTIPQWDRGGRCWPGELFIPSPDPDARPYRPQLEAKFSNDQDEGRHRASDIGDIYDTSVPRWASSRSRVSPRTRPRASLRPGHDLDLPRDRTGRDGSRPTPPTGSGSAASSSPHQATRFRRIPASCPTTDLAGWKYTSPDGLSRMFLVQWSLRGFPATRCRARWASTVDRSWPGASGAPVGPPLRHRHRPPTRPSTLRAGDTEMVMMAPTTSCAGASSTSAPPSRRP